MTMRRSDWLWLGGILGLAAVLRAINLDAGLWYDEIVTLVCMQGAVSQPVP